MHNCEIEGHIFGSRNECLHCKAPAPPIPEFLRRQVPFYSDIATLFAQVGALTKERDELRAEVTRHKEIASEFAQTNVEINCKWFKEKQVREAAETKLIALRGAYDAACKYIDKCPCDPDIYPEQMLAWKDFIEKKEAQAASE